MSIRQALKHRTVPGVIALLATVAGAIHLAHNYLPMQAPASGGAAPPAPPDAASGVGASGLMSLIMPHLSQVMILNFLAFVAWQWCSSRLLESEHACV